MRRVLLILNLFLISISLYADGVPFASYTYDSKGNAVESPSPFEAVRVIYPEEESLYSDLFISDGELYILDTGKSVLRTADRILPFFNADGTEHVFCDAQGLYISQSSIYVADAGNCEIAVFDKETMTLEAVIRNPDTSSVGVDIPFVPESVVADRAGNIYALVPDLYYGALMFSPDGDFIGYFGANPTELTISQRLDQAWKKLLNREQRDAMERFVPVAYTGFDIDNEDFVYTCSFGIENESMKIRKINPSGRGIWDDDNLSFGDMIPPEEAVDGLESSSHFVDVDINGIFLSALDTARGRVFTYDSDGNLISVIGGKGTQTGVFTDPQRIESNDEHIYVLDDADSSITVFRATHYGRMLFEAVRLYSDGLYSEALPYWQEVLRINPGLELAHLGLGKAYEKSGEEATALAELQLSGDRERYSEVFDTLRLGWARENLAWVLAVLVIAAVAVFIAEKRGVAFHVPERIRNAFSPLFHPSELMWELKREKRFSLCFSTALLLSFFVLDVVRYFADGYAFNLNDRDEFSILMSAMNTIGLYMLFVTVNWAVSTISDGKGTYKEIYAASSYALIPLIGAGVVNLLLSHILTLDESVFMSWIAAVSYIWALAVLLLASASIHEYTAGKMLFTFILILLGMAFVLFLVFLFVILVENTMNIASIIFNEIALRR